VYSFAFMLLLVFAGLQSSAQENTDGPANEKAQKTYQQALEKLHMHARQFALDDFKKADKQDGGHCLACEKQMIELGFQFGDWKAVETGASEIAEHAQGQKEQAIAHHTLGMVLLTEGLTKHHDDLFARAHDEFTKAIASYTKFPDALFDDGTTLAHLRRDDEARAQFQSFVKMAPASNPNRQRAMRFIADLDLARARMAPAFTVTTLDGQEISLDALQGKVVLLDFWATWCMPCREALPHMREIASKFQDQPFVILSISLDDDEAKWKQYIQQNGMTWRQYRDGGFKGPISRLFGVEAIPQTFTIDADGVLQDQHIGDASIEGKLKKLFSRARELQAEQKPGPAS
jgi:thiol-disulfide isomerase/thioredoxin